MEQYTVLFCLLVLGAVVLLAGELFFGVTSGVSIGCSSSLESRRVRRFFVGSGLSGVVDGERLGVSSAEVIRRSGVGWCLGLVVEKLVVCGVGKFR